MFVCVHAREFLHSINKLTNQFIIFVAEYVKWGKVYVAKNKTHTNISTHNALAKIISENWFPNNHVKYNDK